MLIDKNRNMIAGIILFAAAALYFGLSFTIPLSNIDKMVGSRMIPQICGVLLMLFSGWLIVENLVKNKKGLTVVQIDEDGNVVTLENKPKPCYLNTVLVLVSFAAYIFLMEKLGFFTATVLYLISQMVILTPKGKVKRYFLYGIVSVCVAAAIYLMFNQLFHLILPRGILF